VFCQLQLNEYVVTYDVINSIVLAENGLGTDKLDIDYEHKHCRISRNGQKNCTNENVNICNVSTSIMNPIMETN